MSILQEETKILDILNTSSENWLENGLIAHVYETDFT